MPLKVTVKVSRITNLSDARYCAGMGVHLLGFTVVPGCEGYVAPDDFQQMRGWFNGPEVVAEIYDMVHPRNLHEVLENYRPDLLEGGLKELNLLQEAGLPFLLNLQNLTAAELSGQLGQQPNPAYIITRLTQPHQLRQLNEYASVLVELPPAPSEALLQLPAAGFVLSGTDEERPGLKNYDSLSNILERLEE
ncbi:MAG: hypothetical protein KatS3mg032_0220 [Cyclobacteriaceae bacterium]|nr:MAG: hypothetical protein KatS3mg032_0220 [Cyclobacteriaceae bacterium]